MRVAEQGDLGADAEEEVPAVDGEDVDGVLDEEAADGEGGQGGAAPPEEGLVLEVLGMWK